MSIRMICGNATQEHMETSNYNREMNRKHTLRSALSQCITSAKIRSSLQTVFQPGKKKLKKMLGRSPLYVSFLALSFNTSGWRNMQKLARDNTPYIFLSTLFVFISFVPRNFLWLHLGGDEHIFVPILMTKKSFLNFIRLIAEQSLLINFKRFRFDCWECKHIRISLNYGLS